MKYPGQVMNAGLFAKFIPIIDNIYFIYYHPSNRLFPSPVFQDESEGHVI